MCGMDVLLSDSAVKCSGNKAAAAEVLNVRDVSKKPLRGRFFSLMSCGDMQQLRSPLPAPPHRCCLIMTHDMTPSVMQTSLDIEIRVKDIPDETVVSRHRRASQGASFFRRRRCLQKRKHPSFCVPSTCLTS